MREWSVGAFELRPRSHKHMRHFDQVVESRVFNAYVLVLNPQPQVACV